MSCNCALSMLLWTCSGIFDAKAVCKDCESTEHERLPSQCTPHLNSSLGFPMHPMQARPIQTPAIPNKVRLNHTLRMSTTPMRFSTSSRLEPSPLR